MHTESSLLQIEGIKCTQKVETSTENLAALIETLRQEVAHGLLDSHDRSNKNATKALEIASFCYALIELLKEKGILSFEELNDRQKVVSQRLMTKFADQGIGIMALQDYKEDKYTYNEEVTIDCASRLHLCQAACCRLDLALSRQDIEEDILKWNFGKPYMIAKDADGYCRHLNRDTHRCTVWQHRPIPCRGYDCRQDDRIWLDFAQGTINPNLEELLRQRVEATQ